MKLYPNYTAAIEAGTRTYVLKVSHVASEL